MANQKLHQKTASVRQKEGEVHFLKSNRILQSLFGVIDPTSIPLQCRIHFGFSNIWGHSHTKKQEQQFDS